MKTATTVRFPHAATYGPPSRARAAAKEPSMRPWPWWQRVFFRFYASVVDLAVHTGNAVVFHVRPTLVPVNGSGDTSWAWAQLCLYLSLAAIACVVWSLLDFRRMKYERL